jgi:hypothetical protein
MADSKRGLLKQLSQLDCSSYPVGQIHEIIQKLGSYAAIITTFHKGKTIVRSRINHDLEVFSKSSELSYKPSALNNFFQRASTPNQTMFYASIVSEEITEGELNNNRIIGLAETSSLMRNKNLTEGEQKITFGKWRLTSDIHVVSIVHHRDYFENNSLANQLYKDYEYFVNEYTQDIVDDSLMISEFFADEFAKSETPNDYDYLLSAIYAERLTHMSTEGVQISGILYPSVRTAGQGFNIAITESCADSCLQLESVLECTIYKKDKKVFIDNDKFAHLSQGQTEFNLEPIIDPKEHSGKEIAYKIVRGKIEIPPATNG